MERSEVPVIFLCTVLKKSIFEEMILNENERKEKGSKLVSVETEKLT
jgi:hypothetical protein